MVDETAPLYPGYVVLRGDLFGAFAKPMGEQGRDCIRLLEDPLRIHPDQPLRFHIGWSTDEPMTTKDARLHFESMVTTVDWGAGPVEMTRHEITPAGNGNYWQNKICSFTVRN